MYSAELAFGYENLFVLYVNIQRCVWHNISLISSEDEIGTIYS